MVRFTYYIDWDDDGFAGYDDISAYVKDAKWSIGMHESNQLTGDETIIDFILNNQDARFSPENSSSPYYGKMLPQKKIKVVAEVNGTEYTRYLGFCENFDVEPFVSKTAMLRGIGSKQYIQEQLVKLPLLEDVRSDEVIAAILEQLHLPPSMGDAWILGATGYSELGETTYLSDLSLGMELDTGASTFPYVADNWDSGFQGNQYVNKDWSTGFKGYDAIVDVVRAERGRFFFDREGKAIFWSRDRLQLNTSVVASYTQKDFVGGKYRSGKNVFNEIHVFAYPRSIEEGNSVVWELDAPVSVRRAIDEEIDAKWVDQESGVSISVVDPFVSSFVATGSVAYHIEYKAKGAEIRLDNQDNVRRRVDAMAISGRKMTTHNQVERLAIDGTSSAKYGRRELRIDSKLIDDPDFAQNVADYELSRWKDPRSEFTEVEMLVKNDVQALEVMSRQIGDRIRISDTSLGHDKEYFIIGEKHHRSLRFGYHVWWYLEEADMSQFWVLGEVGFSELGETTYLAL